MAYLSTGWGVGAVVGPMLGGLLCSPCSPNGILRAHHDGEGLCAPGAGALAVYPYLLPCLVRAHETTLIQTKLENKT
eukprot:3934471-Pyramimonas_sp.AAC.1